MARQSVRVDVEGRQLTLTNLSKVLYPQAGFTKGQVVEYYAKIAQVLVPHLADRPLTLKRYPDGVEGEAFFEKNATKARPEWVRTAPIWGHGRGSYLNFILANDAPTLVFVANLAAIELHPSLSRAPLMESPTMVVFDLDPGPPAGIAECCRAALVLREIFEGAGLEAVAKTSGSKGLQLYVPLNTQTHYDETKAWARGLAEQLEAERPELFVSKMAKQLRPGRILLDWSQNDENKTTVSVYSLRAKERPTVSTPLRWEEVEETAADGDGQRLVFEPPQVLERVERLGDLFAPTLTLTQALPPKPRVYTKSRGPKPSAQRPPEGGR